MSRWLCHYLNRSGSSLNIYSQVVNCFQRESEHSNNLNQVVMNSFHTEPGMVKLNKNGDKFLPCPFFGTLMSLRTSFVYRQILF